MTYKIIPAGHANIDYEQKKNEENFWIFILYLESIQIDRKHFFCQTSKLLYVVRLQKLKKLKFIL